MSYLCDRGLREDRKSELLRDMSALTTWVALRPSPSVLDSKAHMHTLDGYITSRHGYFA